MGKWNDRDIPNVEINLAKLPKWEWACPSQACSKISGGWILEKKSKEKGQRAWKILLASEPLSGMREDGEAGRDGAVRMAGLFTGAERSLTCCSIILPSVSKGPSPSGSFSGGVLCHHDAAVSCVLSGS